MLLFNSFFMHFVAPAAEIANSKESDPAPKVDELQACVDQWRRDKSKRMKAERGGDVMDELGGESRFFQVDPSTLPDQTCASGNLKNMIQALLYQVDNCSKNAVLGKGDTIRFGCKRYTRQEYCLATNMRMLEIALEVQKKWQKNGSEPKQGESEFAEFTSRIRSEFDWYKSKGFRTNGKNFKAGDFQFTAYYTPPAIEASRERTDEFRFPLYKTPPNAVKFGETSPLHCGKDPVTGASVKYCANVTNGEPVPLPSREQIVNENVLTGKGLEIAYIRDALDADVLMTQGSGFIKIRMPDGSYSERNVNFHFQNGKPYIPIEIVVKCSGAPTGSWENGEKVRAYLDDNPDKKWRFVNYNPSFVFYKEDGEGPFGAYGIPVTPGHSLATDPRYIPGGTFTLFNAPGCTSAGPECPSITSTALAQDTGGLIKYAHVDQYCGKGKEAGAIAHTRNAKGSLFVAVPKDAGKQVPKCRDGFASDELDEGMSDLGDKIPLPPKRAEELADAKAAKASARGSPAATAVKKRKSESKPKPLKRNELDE